MKNRTRQISVNGVMVILYASGIAQVCCKGKAKADLVMKYLVDEGIIDEPLDMLVEA